MMSADNSYVATYIQSSENLFNVCVMEKHKLLLDIRPYSNFKAHLKKVTKYNSFSSNKLKTIIYRCYYGNVYCF